jgi:Zn-dependent protease
MDGRSGYGIMVTKWLRLRRIRILGAVVYVHWSVLVVVGLLGLMSLANLLYGVVAIASYLSVIVIHEAGHAWMARRLGCRAEVIHIAFLHGSCEYEQAYSERDDILIAWAGVVAQLAVALPVLLVAMLLEEYDLGFAAPAVAFLGYWNVITALFNLAPAPGLDGHKAWRGVPLLLRWWAARKAAGVLAGSKRRR